MFDCFQGFEFQFFFKKNLTFVKLLNFTKIKLQGLKNSQKSKWPFFNLLRLISRKIWKDKNYYWVWKTDFGFKYFPCKVIFYVKSILVNHWIKNNKTVILTSFWTSSIWKLISHKIFRAEKFLIPPSMYILQTGAP